MFGAAAFPTLRALQGEKAVWRLFDRENGRILRARLVGSRPQDVDTWDDYEAVCAALVSG